MACINDITAGMFLPTVQWTTAAQGNNSTASALQLTGAAIVVFNNSGGTPGTYTTRTATQMIADSGLTLGNSYLLLLINGQGTGTLTFTAGAGVTITGTATVAAITARLFSVQVTSTATPAITFTNVGSFTATALAFGA